MGCALVAATIALVACDSRGKAFEDLRLARLTEGVSSEQDVRALFGAPAAVRDIAIGKGLIYPLGPEGPHTLLLKDRRQGQVPRARRPTDARQSGACDARNERTRCAGDARPLGCTEKNPLKQQSAWEWRFLMATTHVFVVTFDARGSVVARRWEKTLGVRGSLNG